MQDFIRARSAEQKNQRLTDIKTATADLFKENPYHEITLTTIAERLGWSRANLYKYVTTKEEIFLELAADARDEYFNALLEAFPKETTFTSADLPKVAEIWAQVTYKHQDWALYGTILMTIIEVNVTLERLKVFKKGYYDYLEVLKEHFFAVLGIPKDEFAQLLNTIHYHAVGLAGNCANNPLVAQAIAELGVNRPEIDYLSNMTDFIRMCLQRYMS